ncbi:MAG: AsmA family protein [Halieaceae bacterium]|jgi:uncharacterized protein involved in outer membrane biogenesis|nr:AsmA family protein [Halieaceae bacterium]
MRTLLWIIGLPVFVLILAVFLLPFFIDRDTLVALASEQLESQTGVVLRVDGEVSLSLFPEVAVAMSGVRAQLPDSGGTIEADSLATGVALMPLFSGSVEIASLTLSGVTVSTVAVDEQAAKAAAVDTSTLSDRELDAYYALRQQVREKAGAQAAASTLAVGLSLEVGELALRDIRIRTVDSAGNRISEVLLEELIASDINTAGRPIPLSALVTLPDEQAPTDIVLDLVLRSDLNADTLFIDELTARISGATPAPLEVTASGEFTLNTQRGTIELALRSEGLSGEGQVSYATFESPQIRADLRLSELVPALLLLAGPEAAAEASGSEGAASAAFPLHALRMVDTAATLKIDRLSAGAHVLEDVDAHLRIVDGVATLDPVKAQLHGGAIDLSAVFNGRYNEATLSTEGSVTGFDAARATAAMDAGITASGTADLSWELGGSGRGSEELTQSLSGPIRFTTEDISIADIAMEQMVCRGVALVNQESLSAEFPADTRFEALSAEILLEDGVARLDPLIATLPAVGLSGNGEFDLASGDLRASLRAQLSAQLAELDPACRINERYTELRWPVECRGNIADDPADWCGMDVREIVKDLAEGELKRKATEEAGRLLNKLFKR